VTCFEPKYRLVQCQTDDPTRELMTRGKLDDVVAPIVKLAWADGNAAIGYVRKHAKEYGVNPDRIGILGFSAGGTVTASVAFKLHGGNAPELCGPDLPSNNWTIKPGGVPADAPPIFILAATDDPLGLAPQSMALYQDGTAAKKQPNCTCSPRVATASVCENKICPATIGWSASPTGSRCRAC
jgi:acetyl esterase/lipase